MFTVHFFFFHRANKKIFTACVCVGNIIITTHAPKHLMVDGMNKTNSVLYTAEISIYLCEYLYWLRRQVHLHNLFRNG